jgi:2-dehydro-3-deoxy-D-arabinonate dehydratase
MPNLMLSRFYHPEHGERVGVQLDDTIYDVTEHMPSVGAWLRASAGHVSQAIEGLEVVARDSSITFPANLFDTAPQAFVPHWLPPVDEQEVWASGVTYERSREARQEESVDGGDIYARVYSAKRPELFFKALGKRVIGPFGEVGIRADATWSVPEPELAVVINPANEIVGFTVGNDMSSRDIEGENPLYLPQAKVYKASCALGPGIVLMTATQWPAAAIQITIQRNGQTGFEGEVHTSRIKRTIDELVSYLGRSSEFPDGVVLLTGTGVVPPSDFTLQAGDIVIIQIEGIGRLQNTVKVV